MKTCYECGRPAKPEKGRCTFCGRDLCFEHTIRILTTFGGAGWVSWCAECYARYKEENEV